MIPVFRMQISRGSVSGKGIIRSLSSIGRLKSGRDSPPAEKVDRLLQQNSNEMDRSGLKDMPISNMKNPFEREKGQCILCKYKIRPDYKNVKLLSQFVSPYTGRIYGRHITGLCSTQQKRVEEEILKSQSAGFMAYFLKQVEFLKDPKLFDPERPLRPHRF